jgi:hypothetical protein
VKDALHDIKDVFSLVGKRISQNGGVAAMPAERAGAVGGGAPNREQLPGRDGRGLASAGLNRQPSGNLLERVAAKLGGTLK